MNETGPLPPQEAEGFLMIERMTMRQVELLAPAGSMENLKAAVQAGADAVYLAASRFGARSSAENFDETTLREAVDYCHVHGVRVYGAVNTLIKAGEMQDALETIGMFYNCQADAVILQDVGLASLVRSCWPDLELHASTQMSVYDKAGVVAAQNAGFKRIVIARETSVESIRKIVDATKAEIEAFVHGALCYSYSGQCLMSSQIGGRSGNRGRCAQPCRKKYILSYDPESKSGSLNQGFLLSTKDLMTLGHLKALVDSGITSLKIEGRLRKSDYTSAVVSAYRKELDAVLGLESAEVEGIPPIEAVFNRENTVGHILGAVSSEGLSSKNSGNMGQLIGYTDNYDSARKQLTIKLSGPLRNGDGIKVLASESAPGALVNGMFINREKVQKAEAGQKVAIPFDVRVPVGCEVRKTLDIEIGKNAARFSQSSQRKIPIKAVITLKVGAYGELEIYDYEGRVSQALSQSVVETPQSKGLEHDRIREQLSKTGDTPYQLMELEIRCSESIHMSAKELNQMRRDALDALGKQRCTLYPEREEKRPAAFLPRHLGSSDEKSLLSVTVQTVDQLKALKGFDINRVYFTDLNALNEASEIADALGISLCAALPAIGGKNAPQSCREVLKSVNWQGPIRVGNIGQLTYKGDFGPLYGDYTLNCYNPWAIEFLHRRGIVSQCLSVEMSREEMRGVAEMGTAELLVYGSITVMSSPWCPAKCGGNCVQCSGRRFYLKDEKDYIFPARVRSGIFEVQNSRILNLIDAVSSLPTHLFEALRLDFDMETPEQVRKIIESFKAVLSGASAASTDARFNPDVHTTGSFRNGIE